MPQRPSRFCLAASCLFFLSHAAFAQPSLKSLSFKGSHNSYDQPHTIQQQMDLFGTWVLEIDLCGIDDLSRLQVKHGCEPGSSELLVDILNEVRGSLTVGERITFLWLDIKEQCVSECNWRHLDDDARANAISDLVVHTFGRAALYAKEDWEADGRVWPSVATLVARGKRILPIYDNNDHNPNHPILFVTAHHPGILFPHTAFLNVKDGDLSPFPGRSPADGDHLLWRAYDLNTEAEWNNAIAQRIHLPSTDRYYNTWSSNGVVSGRRLGARADFFEGNHGTQDHLCQLDPTFNTTLQLAAGGCPNDEARSLVLTNPPVGRAIRLFDDPGGSRQDDWVEITVTAPVGSFTVNSFEQSTPGSPVRVSFFRNNGLDGKVSRIEVGTPITTSGILSFHSGNGGGGSKVCDLNATSMQINFKNHSQCDNDQARSLTLQNVPAGYTLKVFDSPDCKTNDDWTEIRALNNVAHRIVSSFQTNSNDGLVQVTYHRNNGLDGKVSCVRSP